jgi:hypothetical protein
MTQGKPNVEAEGEAVSEVGQRGAGCLGVESEVDVGPGFQGEVDETLREFFGYELFP